MFPCKSAVLQTAAVAIGNGVVMDVRGMSYVTCHVVGITTATITWEVAGDDIPTYVGALAKNLTSGVEALTATTDGAYTIPVQGCTRLRARISAWTVGTITVTGHGSTGGVQMNNTSVAAVVGAVDTELPAAAALADNAANPTAPAVGAFGMVWDGATWDRAAGTSADGALVNLGANNDVTTAGDVAHGGVDAGAPVKVGHVAIAHGTNPPAVAAAGRTNSYANRAGIPFVIGGHPNVVCYTQNFTGASTDVALVTVGAGTKIVVTRVSFTAHNANTVNVSVRIGFGAAVVPAYGNAGIVASHPGVPAGGGFTSGDGSGILGVGTDNEDLRITHSVPTTGSVDCTVSYYTIES